MLACQSECQRRQASALLLFATAGKAVRRRGGALVGRVVRVWDSLARQYREGVVTGYQPDTVRGGDEPQEASACWAATAVASPCISSVWSFRTEQNHALQGKHWVHYGKGLQHLVVLSQERWLLGKGECRQCCG